MGSNACDRNCGGGRNYDSGRNCDSGGNCDATGIVAVAGIVTTIGIRMTGIYAVVGEAAAAAGADTAEVEASGFVKGFAGSQQAARQLSYLACFVQQDSASSFLPYGTKRASCK